MSFISFITFPFHLFIVKPCIWIIFLFYTNVNTFFHFLCAHSIKLLYFYFFFVHFIYIHFVFLCFCVFYLVLFVKPLLGFSNVFLHKKRVCRNFPGKPFLTVRSAFHSSACDAGDDMFLHKQIENCNRDQYDHHRTQHNSPVICELTDAFIHFHNQRKLL